MNKRLHTEVKLMTVNRSETARFLLAYSFLLLCAHFVLVFDHTLYLILAYNVAQNSGIDARKRFSSRYYETTRFDSEK